MRAIFPIAAQLRVNRWSALYTRGLPEEVALARREELAADVMDQIEWSTAQGQSERVVGRAITWRTIKGAPSDLMWRHAQLRIANPAGFSTRAFAGWLLTSATGLGLGLVLLSLIAVLRDWRRIDLGDPPLMPTSVAALVIACGLVLLARDRTRSLGALWIAAGAPVVVTVGLSLLAQNTTLLLLAAHTPLWGAGQAAVAACTAVFFVAAAVWWMPERGKALAR